MDSLTQLTLGAAVGEAVLGRKIGNKAALWGAICGTIPDLDVLIPFADPVKNFTYHRSFSHSLIILSLLTPLVVWLINKLHPPSKDHKTAWLWLVWLCFVTHILLDCLTIYGTQIFWPVWNEPIGFGSIFIIDPFYTLPLLLGTVSALLLTRNSKRGHLLNSTALAVSTLYLAWSLAAQNYVTEVVQQSLSQKSLDTSNLLVSAGPFNTLLWRIVAMQPNGNYIEGYFSLIDGEQTLTLNHHQSREELLKPLSGHWPVERLRWFSKGFYKVWQQDNQVVMTDLRMGAEPSYVFSFVVARTASPPVAITARQLEPKRDFDLLKKAWRRLWSASAS